MAIPLITKRRSKLFTNLPYWAILMLIVLWSVVPIYIVIMSAFKVPRDIFAFPPTLVPPTMTFENFTRLFQAWPEFTHALLNSAIVALSAVLLTLIICLPAAYAFSRFRGGLMQHSALFIIAVRMFPPLIISVPLFPILSELRLADSQITLVLLYTTFQATMITWIMKGYIDGIPREIEEAAYVDGATMFQVFRLIVVPLARPVLVAAAILTGTYAWNEFQFGFLFTSNAARTAPVVIGEMVGSLTGVQWGNVFAGSVVQFLPALFFLWLIQNHLIRGMTSGSVKG